MICDKPVPYRLMTDKRSILSPDQPAGCSDMVLVGTAGTSIIWPSDSLPVSERPVFQVGYDPCCREIVVETRDQILFLEDPDEIKELIQALQVALKMQSQRWKPDPPTGLPLS